MHGFLCGAECCGPLCPSPAKKQVGLASTNDAVVRACLRVAGGLCQLLSSLLGATQLPGLLLQPRLDHSVQPLAAAAGPPPTPSPAAAAAASAAAAAASAAADWLGGSTGAVAAAAADSDKDSLLPPPPLQCAQLLSSMLAQVVTKAAGDTGGTSVAVRVAALQELHLLALKLADRLGDWRRAEQQQRQSSEEEQAAAPAQQPAAAAALAGLSVRTLVPEAAGQCLGSSASTGSRSSTAAAPPDGGGSRTSVLDSMLAAGMAALAAPDHTLQRCARITCCVAQL